MTVLASLRRLVLCLLVAAPAFAAPPAGAPTLPAVEWKTIQKVIGDQLRALKAGDGTKAMTFAAPGIRDQFGTPENFLRMVREGYAPLLAARYTQFLEGALIEGAVIQPLRLVLPDDTVVIALYEMQRQPDGRWRIAGCVLAPSTVQST
jgi:DNA-binding transcriptional LysR family regulator